MVEDWIKKIDEDICGGSPFEIGDVVKHPDGRMVKIVGGRYWGEDGVSNFWYWREVKDDNSLGEKEHGYGWRSK